MNKIAIIEVKVTLPATFKPHTMTYRAFSQFEKENEKNYVIQRAEELFVKHILEKGKEWKLDKSQLKVKTSVTVYNVHLYIPTENQVQMKYEKDSNNEQKHLPK